MRHNAGTSKGGKKLRAEHWNVHVMESGLKSSIRIVEEEGCQKSFARS